jgi:hypothetical protein
VAFSHVANLSPPLSARGAAAVGTATAPPKTASNDVPHPLPDVEAKPLIDKTPLLDDGLP